MKTTPITPAEMQRHTARFSELAPSRNELAARGNIPVEAYDSERWGSDAPAAMQRLGMRFDGDT